MRNMMDLSSINIYQLHSVRFLRLMRLHRESELKRQNAEDIKTFSVGPSMVHPSILYPRSFGIQCALGPDISGLFPTQAVKHWQILQKKKTRRFRLQTRLRDFFDRRADSNVPTWGNLLKHEKCWHVMTCPLGLWFCFAHHPLNPFWIHCYPLSNQRSVRYAVNETWSTTTFTCWFTLPLSLNTFPYSYSYCPWHKRKDIHKHSVTLRTICLKMQKA